MVLILLYISIIFSGDQGELLSKYDKDVRKGITSALEVHDFNLQPIKYDFGELYKITNDKIETGYVLISEVAACNLGGCPTFKSVDKNANSEYFDMLVLLDTDANIKHIKILDYFSDYGYEITSKKYLKKFYNKNACAFKTDTDHVDAISGATISSYALEGTLSQLCSIKN